MLYPSIRDNQRGLGDGGSLGLFAVLNVIAFILVFFLVEETKGRSLEDLDLVFAVSKRRFMSFQVREYLPWLIKRYVFGKEVPAPELYHDMIWGPWRRTSDNSSPQMLRASSNRITQGQLLIEPLGHFQDPVEMPATPLPGLQKPRQSKP